MATLNELKAEVFDFVRFSLGDEMVDVDLDPVHYEQALKQAIIKYRQRSSNAVEESYSFLVLQSDVSSYTLPNEVISVKQVIRRTIGSTSNSSQQFDAFSSSFLNTYMLQGGSIGGLFTYEAYSQYQKQAQTMFGGYINYTFSPVSKELTLIRRVANEDETVLLWTYNYKPDITLLSDYRTLPWIREYTLAWAKIMLGQARSKFGSIAGPQGGTALNGAELKAEGQAMLDKLDEDLKNYVDGGDPLYWIMG